MAALALILLTIAVGAYAILGKDASHTIKGSITLQGDVDSVGFAPAEGPITEPDRGDPCLGLGGYDDMQEGAEVTVRDEDGTILAKSQLQEGKLTYPVGGPTLSCEFPFTVEGVPDAKFYAIETADRGDLNYSKAEMEEMNWTVHFTLGE